MATTTPTFTWKPGGKPASATNVWFLVARSTETDRPEDELDRRARDLATIHRPDVDALHWRLRWGVLPWLALDRPVCVFCGRGWLCPPAAWAHARLSALGSPRHAHPLEDGGE